MNIVLNGKYTYKLLDNLLNRIEDEIMRAIDQELLLTFLDYNDKYKIFIDLVGKPISIINALYMGISNLLYYKTLNDLVIIGIGNNAFYPKTKIKLSTICYFINNGNLLIHGYPIFSKIFLKYKRMNHEGLI